MGLLSRFKRFLLSDEEWRKLQEYDRLMFAQDLATTIKPDNVLESIENWRRQVKMLEEHPLSQARVINTTILTRLTEILEGMHDKMSELKKLDEILKVLKEEEAVKTNYKPRAALEFSLNRVRHLTVKDKEVIEVLEARGEQGMDSEEMAIALGLARSTVAYRLNRLYAMGIVDKKMVGKKVIFILTKTKQKTEENLTQFFENGPETESRDIG